MRVIAPRRLIEAFTEWSLHEWNGRLRRPTLGPSDPEPVLTGINTAVWYRSPLIARILIAGPQEHCVRVEMPFEEAEMLHIADGRRLAIWTDAIVAGQSADGEFVRALVAMDEDSFDFLDVYPLAHDEEGRVVQTRDQKPLA